VGVRPVAVHGEREGEHLLEPPVGWSSRSPRTALWQSDSARGSLEATGGREPGGQRLHSDDHQELEARLVWQRAVRGEREDQQAGGLGELPPSRSP
jgi:hypothetical protein